IQTDGSLLQSEPASEPIDLEADAEAAIALFDELDADIAASLESDATTGTDGEDGALVDLFTEPSDIDADMSLNDLVGVVSDPVLSDDGLLSGSEVSLTETSTDSDSSGSLSVQLGTGLSFKLGTSFYL
ncbi:hypothetical protein L0F51_19445, partial [Afifella sp. H1R]|uniref:hypothetical protein n=1 Tax=Afifella sp. H1R TaxID=2908841 RepID=UPI001F3C889D